MPLAEFLTKFTGPIQYHSQNFLGEILGPFNAIGGISHEYCWAHSMTFKEYLRGITGHIQCHWQNFPDDLLGPFNAIGT